MQSSYWLDTAPLFEPPAQDLPARCDVAILGAGIMGSALAYYLAAAGRPALVIERNSHPAGGATGRNGGLVIGGPAQSYRASVNKLGREAARAITQLTQLNRRLLEDLLINESIEAGFAVTRRLGLAGGADGSGAARSPAPAPPAGAFAAPWA